jgi:hypothetical protein
MSTKIPLGSDECMLKRGFTPRETYPAHTHKEAQEFGQFMLDTENRFYMKIATTIQETPEGFIVKIWKAPEPEMKSKWNHKL